MSMVMNAPGLKPSPRTYQPDPFAQSNAAPGTIRILLLDDDPGLSHLMAALLAQAGYTVDTGKDGEEGWAALNFERYDLLMTDNDMPRLTGLDLVKRLRKAGIALPVIVVSGSDEVGAAVNDDALRLAAVMRKPFNPGDLIGLVERSCPAMGRSAAGLH